MAQLREAYRLMRCAAGDVLVIAGLVTYAVGRAMLEAWSAAQTWWWER